MCTDATILFSTNCYLAILVSNNYVDRQLQRLEETDRNENGYKDEAEKAHILKHKEIFTHH